VIVSAAAPTLDIVIVSYNTRADLERCLESLAAAPPAVPTRVVVVDNASTDGSPDVAHACRLDPLVVELPENAGFAKGNNAGFRASHGDIVLLLNSDTVVPRGALDALVGALEATPAAAVAGPRLVDATGRAELSFGRALSPLNEARQVLYWRLVEAFPGGVVLPHMSFGRFLQRADAEAATAGENANAAGGIAHLSADFLVCRRDFSIVAAVMLDDGRSALRADPRHQFVLEGAGIALHRIPATDIPPPARLRDLMAHPAVNDCAP